MPTKKEDLQYGLKCEAPTALMLQKAFNIKLKHSQFKYSEYDFTDDKQSYLFEVKNFTYSYDKYMYEIIGVNKGLTQHSVFVFRHQNDDTQTYYIQFNEELFKTFNQRYITNPNRHYSVLCYDIPKPNLTHIVLGQVYTLNKIKGERAKVRSIIEQDELNYKRHLELCGEIS